MLVWSTEFPADPNATCEDALRVALEWITESPHHEWSLSDFQTSITNDMIQIDKYGQSIEIGSLTDEQVSWRGIRHTWTDEHERQWTTEIIAKAAKQHLTISINLHCNLLRPSSYLARPKKPYIIKKLLAALGGGHDADIPISDNPIWLCEHEVDRAAAMITGQAGNRLPIVYVSATTSGHYHVDPDEIAKWLAGMAHVVVEPSTHFSFTLGYHTNLENAYDGAVAIHWPSGSGSQTRLLPNRFQNRADMQSAIAEIVRKSLTYIGPSSNCSWPTLRQSVFTARIKHLKSEGSTDLDEFIREFDKESSASKERIDELEQENLRLRSTVQSLGQSRDSVAGVTLALSQEKPLYPGEIQDAIIDCLTKSVSNLQPNGRRSHIISDIIKANQISSTPESLSEQIKSTLASCRSVGSSEKKTLSSLGFNVSESGKHIKAVYRDDGRYTFTLPKTPSDHRSMKNATSDIIGTLFK